METQIFNQKGEKVGTVELPEKVFGRKASTGLLHEVTTAYLANRRQGDAHTKTRAEVSGGGRKPWKQKHTGRARHGSIRSPIWRKGGVAWGPRNQVNWRQEIPAAKAKTALAQALSARAKGGAVKVVDSLALDGAKTKQVAAILKALGAERRPLVVTEQFDASLARAARNIPNVKIMLAAHLNAYEVMACRNIIITKAALEKLPAQWN
ncbi:MAG TPA: 50S ribosomal protein L4 [Elusimicrobiota bacterium]|jgi:large subunit ribosomal protein L4|nr:50S ribosomal protein L4 [Elusimicrobiota bacterium]